MTVKPSETLKIKVMFNGPLRIYKDYQIIPEPILSGSATSAIEFYFNFSESIPYVWAQEDIFFGNERQTEITRRPAKKFLTNVKGQISNRRLVRRVLERI